MLNKYPKKDLTIFINSYKYKQNEAGVSVGINSHIQNKIFVGAHLSTWDVRLLRNFRRNQTQMIESQYDFEVPSKISGNCKESLKIVSLLRIKPYLCRPKFGMLC